MQQFADQLSHFWGFCEVHTFIPWGTLEFKPDKHIVLSIKLPGKKWLHHWCTLDVWVRGCMTSCLHCGGKNEAPSLKTKLPTEVKSLTLSVCIGTRVSQARWEAATYTCNWSVSLLMCLARFQWCILSDFRSMKLVIRFPLNGLIQSPVFLT